MTGKPWRVNDPHVMYRMFDGKGTLIYVGCTLDLPARMKFHQQQSWWYPQFATLEAEHYENRDDAHKAEMEAIASENPRWNIMHRSYNSRSWTEQNYRDYITAIENQPGHVTPHQQARLDKARNLLVRHLSTQQRKAA